MAVLYGVSPRGGRQIIISPWGSTRVRIKVGESTIIVDREEFLKEMAYEIIRLGPPILAPVKQSTGE